MKTALRARTIAFMSFIVFSGALFAQKGQDVLKQAAVLYADDSFEKAFALISEGIPENTSEPGMKAQTAEALSSISLAEYEAKNWKNAYEGFRKALRYDPTNARATQYFLRIRKERDVSKIANEGAPRDKPLPSEKPAATEKPLASEKPAATLKPAGQDQAAADAQAAADKQAAEAQAKAIAEAKAAAEAATLATSNAQLKAMEEELKNAGQRLSSMENSVSATSTENQVLKSQVEQQIKLIQTMIDAQAKSQSSQSQAAPSQAAAQKQAAQEQAIMAQTMQILTKLAETERSAPQVLVQTDPEVKNLIVQMREQQKSIDTKNALTNMLLIGVSAIGFLLVVSVAIVIVLAVRSRRKRAAQPPQPAVSVTAISGGAGYAGAETLAIAPQASGSQTPLLEFIQANDQGEERGPNEALIKKDLMKAERLKRMYDEVRAGSLSWDTVRNYIGELEVSLRADILKVVEQKLNEGDLLASESILPIIFPFMTDYDDFLKDKAERLAKRALLEEGRDDGTGAAIPRADEGPLSLRSLMGIPQELTLVLKGHDQTLMTAKLSRGIGKTLGLSSDECNLLYKAALAHDCGYLVLDHDRLQATIAKQEITEDDFKFISSHTVVGPTYFGEVEIPQEIKEAILYHHERNDGSGYPDGLKKEAIPRFAKIIGAAETFTALVSKRAYREKRGIQQALAIISDGARTKFDPDIVNALTKVATASGSQG
jgi:HD-GYP domain-containing protein (c-di-GMP phosphodiesterase class II)